MKKEKVLVVLGHPHTDSATGYLADAYERGAKASGREVRRINLAELQFDPILHNGYRVIQELEPDLLKVQEDFKWADHIMLIYPSWWSSMPALLKGMFDRMWLPGYAFNFPKSGDKKTILWKRYMTGRSARVVTTMNSNPFLARILMGDSTNEIRRGILLFSGMFPVRVVKWGGMDHVGKKRLERLGKKMEKWGSKAK